VPMDMLSGTSAIATELVSVVMAKRPPVAERPSQSN
jgi:hypothetical protein